MRNLKEIPVSERGKYLQGLAMIADYTAQKEKEKTFSVPYSEHLKLIEKYNLVEAHLEIILYAIEGQLRSMAGDTAPLQALQEVTENTIELASRCGDMIQALRPEEEN